MKKSNMILKFQFTWLFLLAAREKYWHLNINCPHLIKTVLNISHSYFPHRQEKLEQLAARFDRKAGMRETWLSENQRLVSQDNFGYDLAAVEAATKKHEAIETDINAYEERVQAVVSVANELEQEDYHDIDRINARWAPVKHNPSILILSWIHIL